VAFALGTRGYFSHSLKQSCRDVQNYKPPNAKGPWLRRGAFVFFVILVTAGYSSILVRQRRGDFLCSRIEVQFEDTRWSELPFYSGVYYVRRNKYEDHRLIYKDEATNGKQAIFRYCSNEKAFVFGPLDRNVSFGELDTDYDDVCSSDIWYSKSPTTKSYDLLEARASEWQVQISPENPLTHPVSHFYMQCMDCSDQTCNHPKGGSCGPDATGQSVCLCNEGYFGNQCQFSESEVCDVIEFDHRFGPFLVPEVDFPSRFEIVLDSEGNYAMYRGKTVYTYVIPEYDKSLGGLFLLAYGGRRYYMIGCNWKILFPSETAATASYRFVEYLEDNLKSGYLFDGPNGTLPLFASEPLDLGTPKDRPTPVDLGWFYANPDRFGANLGAGAPISTRLRCSGCNRTRKGYCDFGGTCNETLGECMCRNGYEGPLCESYVGFRAVEL